MKSEIRDQFPLTTGITGLCYFSRMNGMEVLCSIVPPEDIFPGLDLARELDLTFYPDLGGGGGYTFVLCSTCWDL